ncbi:hypothetical protein LPJ61_001988 [Coemansia biformis]|uniref:MARVEL domain-containing protein n=1 Tax=Coemansia biformis TaxID=1286918 RepID=A0A9W8CXL7_9FUNG|nr:hypothetical protein LPJ61_001988 [Coemansia biformis]
MAQQASNPYGGSYSEAARFANVGQQTNATSKLPDKRDSLVSNRDSLGYHKATTTKSEKIPNRFNRSGGVTGVKEMSSWKATRFVVYIVLRLVQLAVALVCLGFQTDVRNKRPGGRAKTTESNTEIATIALAGITAGASALSIIMHLFAKTRKHMSSTKVAWPMTVFNFCLFVTWIVLVLINLVESDCSTSTDGTWCKSVKATLATGLISAMLALVVTLRTFSYKRGDALRVECTTAGKDSGERADWVSPECIETGKALVFQYGHDGLAQCSVKGGSDFQLLLLGSIALETPLRCRMARSRDMGAKQVEFALRVEGIRGHGSNKVKRINGNFNAALHGKSGALAAAAVYPVDGQPLPEAVAGITTMQFNQRWYEGSGLSVLMANRRSEEEFVIQPVVAVMFCILTACAVYVVGRVYVEGTLVPRTLAKHGISVSAADDGVPDAKALKKTN